MTAAEAEGERSSADAAAKMLAIARPTGVATTKPAFFFSSRTPGVASACSARKPALVTNASGQVPEHDAQERRDQDEPEVRGMVLPVDVQLRLAEQEPEADQGQRERDQPAGHARP